MVDYLCYTAEYLGSSIPAEDFPRLAKRAEQQLNRYKECYTVTAPQQDAERLATCAMADALYYFEVAQNTPSSASIGSVSSSTGAVDLSPKAQAKEMYRCACLYLRIYRGCGECSV